jgi:hypothetical protein
LASQEDAIVSVVVDDRGRAGWRQAGFAALLVVEMALAAWVIQHAIAGVSLPSF